MGNPFTAEWTRKQQVMCLGHWIIHYNGKLIDLPKDRYDSDMGTKGIYNYIDPEDELYLDGLDEDEWIVENIEWLKAIYSLRKIFQLKNKLCAISIKPCISKTGVADLVAVVFNAL